MRDCFPHNTCFSSHMPIKKLISDLLRISLNEEWSRHTFTFQRSINVVFIESLFIIELTHCLIVSLSFTLLNHFEFREATTNRSHLSLKFLLSCCIQHSTMTSTSYSRINYECKVR